MKSDKIIRMRLSTYVRVRRNFPAQRGESMSSYFDRLSKHIEREVENEMQ